MADQQPRIGLALGSGSARGWSHIGVIRELQDMGIEPEIVCGTSIGSLVGAALVKGDLDRLERWAQQLTKSSLIKFLDLSLLTGGGFIEGNKLFEFLSQHLGDIAIEELEKPFAAVACNLGTGQEVWFQKGSLFDAVRASSALPGLFTPVQYQDTWLVDGGLVNPVPISVCRALGAEKIIAVNLNGDIVGKHMPRKNNIPNLPSSIDHDKETGMLQQWMKSLRDRANHMVNNHFDEHTEAPGLFDVMAGSINIMQDRITRSRMAGDPPDVIISPRLSHLGLMEFDRVDEAVEAGRKAVRAQKSVIEELVKSL
ncbi:MAG: patatin-like phospholipase RssA [Gammaproteobacteria bacterium]|nr:patatin-like phospholipase RssA [Gammaproteobacteria bacterium]